MFTTYKTEYKKLTKLGMPVIISQLGLFSVQFFDYAMVGSLGALPLAAVSFSASVFWIVFCLITGLSMAITPLVGEAFIQGKKKLASAYLLNALLVFTAISVLTMLLQLAIIPLLYRLGQPVDVIDAALPYYRYLAWSIVPYMIFCCFERFWEGLGNTKINMAIIITANVINIFLNWLLIFGHWGFPRMEAAGAGLATLISRIIMVLFAFFWFVMLPRYRTYLKCFKKKNVRWSYNRTLLKLGLPVSFQTTIEGVTGTITVIMVGWFGTTALAANQITMTVSSLVFMCAIGLSAAATIRISHEYGEKNIGRIRKVALASLHLAAVFGAIIAVLFVFFRQDIIRIFSDDPAVIVLASQLFLFYSFNLLFDGLQIVSVGQLRGIQDVKMLMPISFLCFIAINFPLGYYFAFILNIGVGGLYISFGIGLVLAFILLRLRFLRQVKLLENG